MEEEIWKPVVGYEGLYEVSNLGNVRSLDKVVRNLSGDYLKPSAIKKQSTRPRGYKIVTLTKDGSSKQLSVHRLVAMSFLPNPYNYPEVDHIDRNPSNNVLENLRWCTHEANMNNENTIQYMKEYVDKKECSKLGLAAKIEKGSISAPQKIYQYTKDGEFVAMYDSHNQAAKVVGVNRAAIELVIDRPEYLSCGYLWTSSQRNDVKYTPSIPSFYRAVQQLDTEGNVINEWDSLNKARAALKISFRKLKRELESGELRYKTV